MLKGENDTLCAQFNFQCNGGDRAFVKRGGMGAKKTSEVGQGPCHEMSNMSDQIKHLHIMQDCGALKNTSDITM